MEILCEVITITSEESSNIKGAIQTNYIGINLLDKASINITGSAKTIETESIGNSTFKGSDFKVNNAIVKATNDSKIYINAAQNMDIYARNSSEIYFFSNPKIQFLEFFDRATLYKREADKKIF